MKKDATCLRGKGGGSQYRELTEALDLLLDGPSSVDKQILYDLSAESQQQLLPPQ